jgi:hypothetical protein
MATSIASISVGSAFILRKSVALPSLLGGQADAPTAKGRPQGD